MSHLLCNQQSKNSNPKPTPIWATSVSQRRIETAIDAEPLTGVAQIMRYTKSRN
jgi:hypothetical protein